MQETIPPNSYPERTLQKKESIDSAWITATRNVKPATSSSAETTESTYSWWTNTGRKKRGAYGRIIHKEAPGLRPKMRGTDTDSSRRKNDSLITKVLRNIELNPLQMDQQILI